jgi:peptide/nickel transport system permease protein
MRRYILRRLLQALLVLWGLGTVTFLMLSLLPGDAATTLLGFRYSEDAARELRIQLGLDDPLVIQYLRFWGDLFTGDLGRSMSTNIPVLTAVGEQFPNTVALAVSGMCIAVLLGGVVGVIAAVRSPSWLDSTVMVVSTLGLSVPSFFLGLLLILLFGVVLAMIPVTGPTGLAGLLLPALAVGLPTAGYIARVVRASMLEVLGAEYLITARGKGLSERMVVVRHALRNALIPVVTVIGLLFGQLLGGTIVIENVFARPGLGRLLINAIEVRDIPLVQGAVLVIGVTYVLVNLIVDLSYTVIDPRIRLHGASR